jgi:hypothetical protein
MGFTNLGFFCNSMGYLATRERFVKSMRLIRDNWSRSTLPSLFFLLINKLIKYTYLKRIKSLQINPEKSITHCSSGKQPYFSI